MRTAGYGTQGFRRQQAAVQRFSVAGTLNGGEYRSFFPHYPGVCIPGDGLSRVPPRTAPPPRGVTGGWQSPRTAPPPRGVTGGWQSVGIESGRTVHCMGRSRRRTSSRAVFPCLSFRETCASSVPGHGFPPDIAMTALAPSRGRGLPERNVRVPSPMAIVTTVHCPGEEGRERTSF
jgi:hypothetical protein